MKLLVFCMKDRATDMFATPQFMLSAGQAMRLFGDEVNRPDKDNQLYMHPDDFDLYQLGAFDTSSASFELLPMPELVILGKSVKIRS